MLQDLSMTILDIANNSIKAKASLIIITLEENKQQNFFKITIEDNGVGMSEATLKKVVDPFFTSRTTRKVGLGVPFFKELAEMCDGEFSITSKEGVGTTISSKMRLDHLDRPPLGNLVETIITLISASEEVDYVINYYLDDELINFDTRIIKETLEGLSINTPEILVFLKEYLNEQFKLIKKN